MTLSSYRPLLLPLVLLLMLAIPAWLGGSDALALIIGTSAWFLLCLLLLNLIRWGAALLRWQLLLKQGKFRLKTGRLLAISLAIDLASENTPAASGGGAAALWLFKREAGIPVAASIGLCAQVLSFDLAAVLLLLTGIVSFLLMHHATLLVWPALLGGLVLCLALAAFLLLLKAPHRLSAVATSLGLRHLFTQRIQARLSQGWQSLAAQLKATNQLPARQKLSLLLLSIIYWGARFSFLFVAVLAVGGNSGWATTAIIQFVSTLAGLFTLLPGGFPGTDVSITALLHASESLPTILSALILWRLATYHLTCLAGALAFGWLWLHRHDANAQPNEESP